MSILLVGLNHKTAPVEVRERLAFTDEACAENLRALVDGEVVREGLIVSTCNRVEVLAAAGQKGAEAAKRVRNETGIAASAVSISYTAVELGRKIFGSLKGATVLLVGAGEMAELAAQHLAGAGATRLLVANRTYEKAQELAVKFGGEAVEFDALEEHLSEADIVICSTGAPDYVITPEMAERARAARRNRPAFYIDISVPRNVDPAVAKLANLFVFDVDDLEAVVASNIREREREAERAELIVEAEARQFEQV